MAVSAAEKRAAQAFLIKRRLGGSGISPTHLAGASQELGVDHDGVIAFLRRLYQAGSNQDLTMAENTRAAAAAGG